MGRNNPRKYGACNCRRGCLNIPPDVDEPSERYEKRAFRNTGTLYMVATPIGNLEDVTLRAIRILKEVSLIAAEDTRRTRILMDKYGISTPLTSLYEQNEAEKSGLLIAELLKGKDIVYVSDAGTPGISDPGYILVREAISHGVRVEPVPGACALIAALSVSGLPMDSFIFMGFLPSKALRRRRLLTALQDEDKTLIFYESPRRLLASLNDIAMLLGNRQVVVSREMTKVYEEFLRGSADAVAKRLGSMAIKGEVTLIVSGKTEKNMDFSDADIIKRCERIRRDDQAASRRDLVDRIVCETGVSRRRIYRLLISS